MERTFAMVKPDAYPHVGEILTRIHKEDFTIVEMRQHRLTAAEVDALYAEHAGRMFYAAMKEFLCSGPVVLMVLEREDAVAHWRRVLGPTDPKRALREFHEQHGDAPLCEDDRGVATLRAVYGDQREEGPMFCNGAHGSDLIASAVREIKLFFKSLDTAC